MKTTQTIQLRIFGVRIRNERTGEISKDKIVFTKQQLQVAQMVGEGSDNLIRRAYNRAGYRVLETIWAEKREAILDLESLWKGNYEDKEEQGAPLDLVEVLGTLKRRRKPLTSERVSEANKGDLDFLMLECGMTLDRIKKEWENRPDGCTWTDFMASIRNLHARGEPLVPPDEDLRLATVKPTLVRACDVAYEPPHWTIAPYIQRGKGTLIQADAGIGKTAFACAIAAHVSTGRPLLELPVETPGNVLILSVEDDLPVLRGRIEASGGDLAKCHFLTNSAGLSFASPEVETAIRQTGVKLVIFDPLQAFIGAKVDMFRANETRPELAKLFEMCDRNDCACIIIAHMSKSAGDKSPVNRALGSADIPAAMRSILQIIQNPSKNWTAHSPKKFKSETA